MVSHLPKDCCEKIVTGYSKLNFLYASFAMAICFMIFTNKSPQLRRITPVSATRGIWDRICSPALTVSVPSFYHALTGAATDTSSVISVVMLFLCPFSTSIWVSPAGTAATCCSLPNVTGTDTPSCSAGVYRA